MTVIVLVVNVPLFALNYLFWNGTIRIESPLVSRYVAQTLNLLFASLAAGAVTYGVVQTLRGRPVTTGESIRVGIGRLAPVLGTGLLTGGIIVLGLGLLVPGVIFLCGYAVAVPAAVIERVSGLSALGRSWRLTSGAKRAIFGAYVMLGIVAYLVQLVERHVIGERSFGAILAASALRVTVYGGISAVLGPVLYHDLRSAKEGASIEEIARVFD